MELCALVSSSRMAHIIHTCVIQHAPGIYMASHARACLWRYLRVSPSSSGHDRCGSPTVLTLESLGLASSGSRGRTLPRYVIVWASYFLLAGVCQLGTKGSMVQRLKHCPSQVTRIISLTGSPAHVVCI
jgi:hypothetical protein